MSCKDIKILDCTLRDGGYYNDWSFPSDVVCDYLTAMAAAKVNIVELGLRSLKNESFKGASAFTTDAYLNSLTIPESLSVAVMVNASELVSENTDLEEVLDALFPSNADSSPVDVVRIACHVHEFERALPATNWLKNKGYAVGFNLMQVADRSEGEVKQLSKAASDYDIDALYFADSMGSMDPAQCIKIINWLRDSWTGAIGIHTHDNMGKALQNTLASLDNGVTWLDATVTGMGRGPGNARTEELVIELAERQNIAINMIPLMSLIRTYFQPLKNKCGWGSNPYYFLSGKYGIHPTYIQEMLSDNRFSEEDIFAAIDHLKVEGGKKYSANSLNATRNFFEGEGEGNWAPKSVMEDKAVLIIGAGPSTANHKSAIETFVAKHNPIVIALNTQSTIRQDLIDFRVASHPVRLLADCDRHVQLPQPLITPVSRLPVDVIDALEGKQLFDFGLEIEPDTFEIKRTSSTLPNSLVISYALSIAASGGASKIFLAGFDGFGAADSRTQEMQKVFNAYKVSTDIEVISITNTEYDIKSKSVYGM